MRLLFIRLSALGDVIHALPAAYNIKNKHPDTKLTWIVEPPQLELLKDNELVDQVIAMPKSAWVSGLSKPGSLLATNREIVRFFSDLRKMKFDIAVDLQGLLKSSLIGYISGAPIRVGYGSAREFSHLLYSHRMAVDDFYDHDNHIVDLHLQLSEYLLRIIGADDVESSAKARFLLPPPKLSNQENIDRLLSYGPTSKPGIEGGIGADLVAQKSLSGAGAQSSSCDLVNGDVVFIPGTTWQSKIWPYEKWADLASLLYERYRARMIIIGGPGDGETNRSIKAMIEKSCPGGSVLDLTGSTSIIDLIELLGRVPLVIGLDTGPLHLAAAVQRPKVIAIHGATAWGRNGPYGEQCKTVQLELSCQPCFKRVCPLGTKECLTELTARHVFSKVEELFAN